MVGREISFELERFEWVTPERLEVEGSWNGVRRLVRATLLIEVDGETRRLRALPGDGGSPEEWSAAFAWDGKEMPKLEGAELEVGRSIVVDLPRPRTSKARGAAKPQKPIQATTRAEKKAEPAADAGPTALELARAEAAEAVAERDSLRAELESLRAGSGSEADSAREELEPVRAQAEEAAAERDSLRAELEAAAAERDSLRTQAQESAAELEALRAQADEAAAERDSHRAQAEESGTELEALRAAAEEAAAERDSLRTRSDEAASEGNSLRRELDTLRARVEDAELQRDALRAQADEAVDLRAELESLRARAEDGKPAVTPDVARLRAELESVERERSVLRAKLDATQPMAPPTQDTPRRFDRRPAERTAKRTAQPEPTASLADKVTDWVGTVMGTRDDDDEGSKNGESQSRTRTQRKTDGAASATDTAVATPAPATAAARARTPRRRTAVKPHAQRPCESPSWLLRVAAFGLLALLLITLVVIVSSIL